MSEPAAKPENIQKNQVLELEIVDLAYGGKGLARVGDFVIFVTHGVPGDRVRARVTKRKKRYAEARIVEMIEASPERVDPPCPLFGRCGGCTWQNIPYERQLEQKQKQAESTLEHLGGVKIDRIEPIIASPEKYRYRNKMDFTFGSNDAGEPIIGFHLPGRFSDILEVPACLLQPEPLDALLVAATKWVREKGLKAYNPHTHQGFLRHLVLRHSKATDEFVGVLLTNRGELPEPESLVEALREACPNLKGFVWGLNAGVADIARQDKELGCWGEPFLEEMLGDYTFRVSPLSFFQVNTPAAEKLYDAIRDMVGGDGRVRLLDAYCGTGSIGIFCSDRVSEVVGIEVVRDAVWDARDNATRNGIENCTFLAGEMRDALPLAEKMPGAPFGCVIMDPPRGGMDKRSLRGLLAMGAPELIYVSCNPSTLARDLVTITEAGYRPVVMQPVDLFPQTFHIETIVKFVRKGGQS